MGDVEYGGLQLYTQIIIHYLTAGGTQPLALFLVHVIPHLLVLYLIVQVWEGAFGDEIMQNRFWVFLLPFVRQFTENTVHLHQNDVFVHLLELLFILAI